MFICIKVFILNVVSILPETPHSSVMLLSGDVCGVCSALCARQLRLEGEPDRRICTDKKAKVRGCETAPRVACGSVW